jgi:hypothetical protein
MSAQGAAISIQLGQSWGIDVSNVVTSSGEPTTAPFATLR